MKKNILIISYILCVLLIACQSEPVPTPNPGEEPTDTIIDTIVDPAPPEEELCEPVCDSCPYWGFIVNGMFQYFDDPVIIHSHHQLLNDTVHAIILKDSNEIDTLGILNDEMIPDCLKTNEKTHVKACLLTTLVIGFRNAYELFCIEKLDD